jgi:hypothetical protein
VRHRLRHQLRPPDAQQHLAPGHGAWVGQPALPVGDLGERRARDCRPRVRQRRLFPPIVRQLRGGGQPGAVGIGLFSLYRHGARRSAAARWRRLHDRALLRSQPRHPDQADEQPRHAGQ